MRAIIFANIPMLISTAALAQSPNTVNVVHCGTQQQNSSVLNTLDVVVKFKDASPDAVKFSGRQTLPTSATDPRLQSFVAEGSAFISGMHPFIDAHGKKGCFLASTRGNVLLKKWTSMSGILVVPDSNSVTILGPNGSPLLKASDCNFRNFVSTGLMASCQSRR